MANCTSYPLLNGKAIPSIGYGTYKLYDSECVNSVRDAIEQGFRLIDTAYLYKNEEAVGQGIRAASIPREDIFVTTKVWNTERGYDKTLKAFDESLKRLGLEYLDLFLIHWPAVVAKYPDFKELNLSSWKALMHLYKEGRVKAIGVSNFTVPHLEPLLDCEIKPMVTQLEFHPGYTQDDTVKLCKAHGIVVEAWSPLGRGRVLEDDRLKALASKYQISVAQLCIAYCYAHKIVPLVKSSHKERMQSNLDAYKLELAPEDVALIDAIGGNLGWSGEDPETNPKA